MVESASMLGFAKFSPCCNYKFLYVFRAVHPPSAPPELLGIAFAMLAFIILHMKKVRFCKVYCVHSEKEPRAEAPGSHPFLANI